jgi:hypothetical protein
VWVGHSCPTLLTLGLGLDLMNSTLSYRPIQLPCSSKFFDFA